jgi:hypothetical protein
MTKDEMVKVLRYKAANIKAHIHPSFFAEIADYLEAQKVDAISRKAVDTLVDELARAISDERDHISRGRSAGEIMQDIIDLPSVTPKQKTGKWIKLKDQSPETYQNVLVKDIDGDVTCAYIVDEVDACTSFYESFSGECIEDVVEWREIQE